MSNTDLYEVLSKVKRSSALTYIDHLIRKSEHQLALSVGFEQNHGLLPFTEQVEIDMMYLDHLKQTRKRLEEN